MNRSQREDLRHRLESMREGLVAEGDLAIEPGSVGPSTKPDEDEAPHAEMGQVIASTRNRERTLRLERIDAALRRLRDEPEDYGRCESCDEDIPLGRLELMPWVRLCIRCQEREENDVPRGRRNITDYG